MIAKLKTLRIAWDSDSLWFPFYFKADFAGMRTLWLGKLSIQWSID